MKLTMRKYRDEDDYWRIRAFLRHLFLRNDRRELSWQVYRFDYWRWHGIENLGHGCLEDDVFFWETDDGQTVAVLNREGPGQAFLQVDPGLRTPELEAEMLAAAEANLGVRNAKGQRTLDVWANAQDGARQALLASRGYVRSDWPEYQRRRSLTVPVPELPVAASYTVRALGDADELPARCQLSWQAFHPDDPEDAPGDWDWYPNIQRAPLYRRDLDLVAVAPDGELAAFCTVWFDDVTRTGAFEPVGTAPAHQRRGLGKAVIFEGLRRLKRLGATLATVGSYSAPAHALYASTGFTAYDLSERWTKEL
jgi:mycothiol synthase